MAARIAELRTSWPSTVNGGIDHDIETVPLAEGGQRGRRPTPLETERRVGRHQEPASPTRERMRSTKTS